MRDLADTRVVVTKEHEDGVVVEALLLGQFHQAADVEVQQTHGIELLHAARTSLLHLLQR